MTQEYRAKVFKSGNSVALRLPKGLGLEEGDEMVIVPHASGKISIFKQSDSLDVLMGLYGAFSADFMADGRGDIEQQDYVWSLADAHRKAS